MSTANLGPSVVAAMTVELVLQFLPTVGRIYIRTAIKQLFGWDDVMVIFGLLLTIGFTVAMYVAVYYGFGKHIATLPKPQAAQLVLSEMVGQTFAIMAFLITKLAVAMTMMRVFPSRPLHLTLWVLMALSFVIFLLCAVLDFVQCSPSEHLWNLAVPAKCWEPHAYPTYAIFTGAWGAFIDFFLAALPWYYITQLQMNKKERGVLAFCMSLGFFGGVCAIVKSVYLKNLSSRTDYAYDTVPIILWSATEICLVQVAACLPLLKPLLLKVQGKDPNSAYSAQPQEFQIQTFSGGRRKGDVKGARTPTHARLPSRSRSEEAILEGGDYGNVGGDKGLERRL